eukprot:12414594-Karenia_brevis.AAC.1
MKINFRIGRGESAIGVALWSPPLDLEAPPRRSKRRICDTGHTFEASNHAEMPRRDDWKKPIRKRAAQT